MKRTTEEVALMKMCQMMVTTDYSTVTVLSLRVMLCACIRTNVLSCVGDD